jgi:hypothetical protein
MKRLVGLAQSRVDEGDAERLGVIPIEGLQDPGEHSMGVGGSARSGVDARQFQGREGGSHSPMGDL